MSRGYLIDLLHHRTSRRKNAHRRNVNVAGMDPARPRP